MKWKKKYIIYSLLAGLILLTNSCKKAEPKLELITVKQLNNFPSASAIEFHHDKIYLFGDDAAYLIVLDSAYNFLDSIRYMSDTAYRVAKSQKDDIEAATAFDFKGRESMVAFGSMSLDSRTTAFVFPLDNPHHIDSITLMPLKKAMVDIKQVNVEGAVMVQNKIVFVNRANESFPENKLLIVDDYQKLVTQPYVYAIKINLPAGKTLAGLSGIHYVTEKDQLFFTTSEEETANAVDDGTIGSSSIGWINNFSKKLTQKVLQPDYYIPLASINKAFEKQKIEAVCVTHVNGNQLKLTLASDNDDGQSTLFKMLITF
jgi:hypothetical protein